MEIQDSLTVADWFLAEPIQISKGNVKVDSSRWPEIDTITVTHHEDGAVTGPIIAEVREVSNDCVRADKVDPSGERMVLPGEEIAITIDTIKSGETLLADVSAATNIDHVYPTTDRQPGALLKVRVVRTTGSTAVADVVSVQDPGVKIGNVVNVQLERGSAMAEFEASPLSSFTCNLNRKPTAGGSGVVRITAYSADGLICQLESAENRLQVGDCYVMLVDRDETLAKPLWDDSVGVQHVSLEEPAAASTKAFVELTEVEESVRGQIIEYPDVPDVGSTHCVMFDRGQDEIVLNGIPIYLNAESKVSGQGVIEVTTGDIQLEGRIIEYHDLPEIGETATVTLDRGQDFLMFDGVPVQLSEPSQISGEVSIEIVEGGLPFEARIAGYHGLPNTGEVLNCRVSQGDSELVRQGIPIQFSPASRVGGLDVSFEVLNENPPIDARLIDYPSIEEGTTVRAEVDSDDLTIAQADVGDYQIDLVEAAEKAADVRVRLITVMPNRIEGEIDGYLSIGSSGQNLDRNSTKKSPFQGTSKNDEITGKKL